MSGQSLFLYITMSVLTKQDWMLHLPGTILHELCHISEDSWMLQLVDAAMPFVWLGGQFWCCTRYSYFHFMPAKHRDLVLWATVLVLGTGVWVLMFVGRVMLSSMLPLQPRAMELSADLSSDE